MSTTEQQEQEIVVGVVQGIVQKAADKWQVEVNIGQQNPRRIWTKDPGQVGQLSAMIGQTLSFMCGVSNWTNNQNQPVRSLWLNGFGQPGAAPAPMPAAPPVIQQQWQQPQPAPPVQTFHTMPVPTPQAPVQQVAQGPSPYERDQRIMREAAAGVSVQLLRFLMPEHQNFENLIRLSERLVAYYENGVQWGQGSSPAPSAPAGQDGGMTQADDDIPF